ncbi:hypothetical protein BEP19_01015 [Ammoniphilus oxalaticus]|uniref:ABC transporter substrate-binding protein n=1 Tax=Ammoniphilus oxalaticus TaxID=66863 RepID=A0A419SMP8_9BACL|nr:metal ABC transporter substrate-binding protein [Ammoniphilus oxalaticus]RKD25555.1 hypothetical protein BEP19_01015 [Ammoniphilus oxalaticus]
MERRRVVWLLVIGCLLIVSGCGQQQNASQTVGKGEQLSIYTSLFPLYDFTRKIAGERAEVKNIVPPGVEAHDFEPKAKDMMMLNDADLLIYNGAGFEGWIEKVSAALNNDKLKQVDASQGIDLLPAEGSGEEALGEEGHHGHGQSGPWDPHVWLDPNRAKQQAETIRDALIEVDPAHQTEYERNYEQLARQFDELDARLDDLREHVQQKSLVVSHASFGYLTETYDFEQIAIAGLSPANEPTQRELQLIIEQIEARQVTYILFETLVSGKIAEVIKKEVGAEALTLNPLENVTEKEVADGKDYFAIMDENIDVLKKALDYRR